MACPLKYKFSKEHGNILPPDADYKSIITTALKETYIKHLHMLGMGKVWPVSSASRYFSKKWSAYKKQLDEMGVEPIKYSHLLLLAQEKILTLKDYPPKGYEVGAVDYIGQRNFKGEILITTKIDCVFVIKDQRATRVKVVIFEDKPIEDYEVNYANQLKALISYSIVRRELLDARAPLSCSVFNCMTGETRPINIRQEHAINYPRVVRNVIAAIESGISYPIASKENCKSCIYNKMCSWKTFY